MKKYINFKSFFNTAITAVLFLFYSISPIFAQGSASGEVNLNPVNTYDPYVIKNFDSSLNITSDEIDVVEKISVHFNESRHGIFRYLPEFYEYHSPDGKVNENSRLNVNINSIQDDKGNKLNYTSSEIHSSIYNSYDLLLGLMYNAKKIQIGDSTRYAPNDIVYVLNYTLSNFPHNESAFQYGLTGTDWDTTIENFSGNIKFDKAPSNFICDMGLIGTSNNKDNCNIQKVSPNNFIITAKNIEPANGVQFISNGYYFNHKTPDILIFLKQNFYLLIPTFALILLFIYWYRTQRAPKGTGVIVPQFDIPDNLKPAQVGTIYDDSVDKVDVSATIIDLAVKGYIKVINTSDNPKKSELELQRLKNPDEELDNYEKNLMNALFQDTEIISLKDFARGDMYNTYGIIQNNLYLWGVQKGLYTKKPDKAASMGYAVFFTALVIAPAYIFNLLNIASIIFLGVLVLIVSTVLFLLRNFKSKEGVLMKEKVDGLKLFIEYAKKDQLEMLQTPMNKQQIFEKYLPYAMVFGLHKAWTEAFRDFNLNAPDWYSGPDSSNFFTNLYIYSVLNNFSNSVNTAFAAPTQSGSGFAGGIGGGGIGGGFSGGGGGSW